MQGKMSRTDISIWRILLLTNTANKYIFIVLLLFSVHTICTLPHKSSDRWAKRSIDHSSFINVDKSRFLGPLDPVPIVRPIFFSLSYCVLAAITKHHRRGSLQTAEFISHSTGGWKVENQETSMVGWETSFGFIAGTYSLFPHMVESPGITPEPLF